MARKQGTTVIIVTHNASLAPIADRVIRMHDAKIKSVELNPNPPKKSRTWNTRKEHRHGKKQLIGKMFGEPFVASKGRMLSIALLMALGSFALIGLKVTSPNMQKNWGNTSSRRIKQLT